jgi:hypothetical protein
VSGALEHNGSPGAHIAIAAINRIGEKSLPYVSEQQFEERLSVGAVQLRGAAFEGPMIASLSASLREAKAPCFSFLQYW